jgi:hypothetical protein
MLVTNYNCSAPPHSCSCKLAHSNPLLTGHHTLCDSSTADLSLPSDGCGHQERY